MDEQIGTVIEIPMRSGHKLCVCYNCWSDEYPDELCTYIRAEDGTILQDIAVIREHKNRDAVEVMVYADDYNEDYTDRFEIKEHDFSKDN